MLKTLEIYVRCEYNYAKKTNHYDTIQAHFHNAYGATAFAMDMAQTQEEYHALDKFWEEWQEKFDDHLWNTPLNYNRFV